MSQIVVLVQLPKNKTHTDLLGEKNSWKLGHTSGQSVRTMGYKKVAGGSA